MISFAKLNLFTILVVAVLATCLSALAQPSEPDPHYWRFENIAAKCESWQAMHPEILEWRSIGTSGQGRTIWAAHISDNVGTSEEEPCLIFHAAQHANECNGTTAIMRNIEELVFGYGNDPVITARVDGLEMWFVPVMNPDGHEHVFASGATSWPDWRKTLRDNNGNGVADFPGDGVDLNRNWDWYWDESPESSPSSTKYKGPLPFSEPEAVAMRILIANQAPVIVVDYHSPVTITWKNYIFYPWQSQHGKGFSPDRPVAEAIAQEWAARTLDVNGQPFRSAYAFDALPKQQCWSYGTMGILSYLMEIGEQCWFEGADVDTVGARVARGANYLIDRVLHGPGIRGVVTDATTGQPLKPEIQLAEMHQDYVGPRLTERQFGSYYRLTLPGAFTVKAMLDGYTTQTYCVTVPDSGWVRVDIALSPVVSAAPEDDFDAGWLKFANPISSGQSISLALPNEAAPATVELFDMRGRRIAALGEGLSAACIHSLRLPARLPAGVYLLRIRSGAEQQLSRVVLIQ